MNETLHTPTSYKALDSSFCRPHVPLLQMGYSRPKQTCFIEEFEEKNDLEKALGHNAKLLRSAESTIRVDTAHIYILFIIIIYYSKTNRFEMVPGLSR